MRIRWRAKAIRQLGAIERFIERDNPRASRSMEERITVAVRALADHPNMGRPGRVAGTRELVVAGSPYIVAYAVIGDAVVVLAVLHTAQKWPDAL